MIPGARLPFIFKTNKSITMINQLVKELLDCGYSELPNYAPKDLDLNNVSRIDRLLDNYSNKWIALQELLRLRRQEIIKRSESISLDRQKLQQELEDAIVTVRKEFTTAYPLVY